jgi:tetratricopeptide (TPR) repeat protein
MTIMNKGLVAHRLERFAEARTLFEESAAIFEELGERNIGASAQVNLGIVLLALREEAQALATFTKALRIVVDTGSLENIAACFEGLSQLARWRGDVARSVRLAGAAESIRITHEIVRQPVDQSQWDAENREYALQVGEELYARHFAEGQALELEVAVALGLEMAGG